MRWVTPDMLAKMDINGDGQLGIDEWVINILALEEATSDEDFCNHVSQQRTRTDSAERHRLRDVAIASLSTRAHRHAHTRLAERVPNRVRVKVDDWMQIVKDGRRVTLLRLVYSYMDADQSGGVGLEEMIGLAENEAEANSVAELLRIIDEQYGTPGQPPQARVSVTRREDCRVSHDARCIDPDYSTGAAHRALAGLNSQRVLPLRLQATRTVSSRKTSGSLQCSTSMHTRATRSCGRSATS